MKIGILSRPMKRKDGKPLFVFNQEIVMAIEQYGGIAIGLFQGNWELNKEIIKELDGFILQGGDEMLEEDLKLAKYLWEQDIPTLGICLGMQTMAVLNGTLKTMEETSHHAPLKNYVHEITIKKGSKLSQIFHLDRIMVNSRHHDHVVDTSFDIVAYSFDGYIEAIEDSTKHFFVGVQWHPESMLTYDLKQQALFETFMKSCWERL